MPEQNFDLSFGSAVELHLADVCPDLHAVGSGVHAESAADGAGDSDQALHSTEIVLRAIGNHAAQVRRGVHARQLAFENDGRLRSDELQNYPGQFAVAHKQVRTTAQELVRNMAIIEQPQEARNALMLMDAKQIGGAANAEVSQFRKRTPMKKLDIEL